MPKRTCLVLLTAVLFFGSACPPQQGGSGNPDNTLVPRPWTEESGNKRNTSFNGVHSQLALPPFRKWSAPLGTFPTAPVIDSNGVIWTGDADGNVVGINPDGSRFAQQALGLKIDRAPAINPETNEIFVRGNQVDERGRVTATTLYRLSPSADLLAVSGTSMATYAAPKLWGNYLFLTVQQPGHLLYVFDQTTLNLVAREGGEGCFDVLCAGFDPPAQVEQISSVAVIDQAAVVGDPTKPIVVVLTGRCATALRFDPSADPPLTQVWSRPLVSVDCDYDYVTNGSPVIMADGTIVFWAAGPTSVNIRALDPLTGDTLWTHKVDRIPATLVTTGLRQLYLVVRQDFITLDSNGIELSRQAILGINAGSAISLDHVYVATTAGLYTLGLTAEQGFAFDSTAAGIGTAYVAVAEDSTVYVTLPDTFHTGKLLAYSPSATLARAVAIPTVTWQTPADGVTITSAPGKTLTVDVTAAGGTPFAGTVSFASSIDGALCDVSAQGATATCTTSKALSLGTHTLTALAKDPSGGANSAAITVQVSDTPPTVTITAPAANAVFQQGTAITFTAQVSDPDQASFSADKVQWTSSIEGNIGSGLSFTKTLTLGTHTITATATDQSGMTGSASVSIQVTQGPVVTIQQPADNSQFNDITSITFTASVVDTSEPSFPASGVKWTSNLDGDLGAGLTISHKLSVGNHTITVTATDSHGLTGQATVHLTIFSN